MELQELLEELRSCGITSAELPYHNWDDSGYAYISEVKTYPYEVGSAVRQDIYDFAMDELERRFDMNFGDGDNVEGLLTIDVAVETVTCNHKDVPYDY